MNDETYTPCTKCGRPMAYCKGQCCGQPKGCECREYGPMKKGCIRQIEPSCPYEAVIPTLTVEDKSNIKDLADCFVHVSNINTTFYIDDKHRMIVTWAGPVEYDNYDLATNSLGLRSQFLIDFANQRGAYYDKVGNYQIFNFGNNTPAEPLSVTLNYEYDPTNWPGSAHGALLMQLDSGETRICVRELPQGFTFTNDATGTEISAEEVFNALEDGEKVIFNNIPLGIDFSNPPSEEYFRPVDGVSISSRQDFGPSGRQYCGNAAVGVPEAYFLTLGFIFGRYIDEENVVSYYIMVDGIESITY